MVAFHKIHPLTLIHLELKDNDLGGCDLFPFIDIVSQSTAKWLQFTSRNENEGYKFPVMLK